MQLVTRVTQAFMRLHLDDLTGGEVEPLEVLETESVL
jgi:hypothetical protein